MNDSSFARFLTLTLLVLGVSAGSLAAQTLSDADRQQLELELETARAELDRAAEHLASLSRQLYALETTGESGQRPVLGVLLGEVGPLGGLLLAGITPGGGAEAAGLAVGDELTSVNNVSLTTGQPMQALQNAMAEVAVGDAVVVGYVRDGSADVANVVMQAKGSFIMGMAGTPSTMAVRIDGVRAGTLSAQTASTTATSTAGWVESGAVVERLESLEALQASASATPLYNRAVHVAGPRGGLRLEPVSGDLASYFGVDEGVLVLSAPPAANGEDTLKAGDILRAVNGETIAHPGGAFRLLLGGQHAADGGTSVLSVEVLRQGATVLLALTPQQLGGGANAISIRADGGDELEVLISPPPTSRP
ncbi:MAG: PDZ domain-containing protein [Pseudomonadota bacterium]